MFRNVSNVYVNKKILIWTKKRVAIQRGRNKLSEGSNKYFLEFKSNNNDDGENIKNDS